MEGFTVYKLSTLEVYVLFCLNTENVSGGVWKKKYFERPELNLHDPTMVCLENLFNNAANVDWI